MKRIPIREGTPQNFGTDPEAKRPLSSFRSITVICQDCGEGTVLDEAALAEMSAIPTFGDFARLSFCPACRDAGATGPANLEIRPERRDAPPPREVEWSTKRVFGDDRSDLHPNLPRSRLMRRRED